LLREILLERPARGQDTVAEEPVLLVRRPPPDQRRDREHLARQRVRARERRAALGEILDHVEHEAEVHHVRLAWVAVGREVRIPPGGADAQRAEDAHVVPTPAPVVEHRPAPVEEPVPEERLHRRRQAVPLERRPVALHLRRKRQIVHMARGPSGRLVPRVVRAAFFEER
jgi:hypothetical protein